MIQFIVVSSFFLLDYISFIFSLVFFFVVFFFGVVVFLFLFCLPFHPLIHRKWEMKQNRGWNARNSSSVTLASRNGDHKLKPVTLLLSLEHWARSEWLKRWLVRTRIQGASRSITNERRERQALENSFWLAHESGDINFPAAIFLSFSFVLTSCCC